MTDVALSSFGQDRVATCSHLTKTYLRSGSMHAEDVVDTGASWMLKASHHEL